MTLCPTCAFPLVCPSDLMLLVRPFLTGSEPNLLQRVSDATLLGKKPRPFKFAEHLFTPAMGVANMEARTCTHMHMGEAKFTAIHVAVTSSY